VFAPRLTSPINPPIARRPSAEGYNEIAESDPSVTNQMAVDLVEGITASFALQDAVPSKGFT
jgi:hypothetical protein